MVKHDDETDPHGEENILSRWRDKLKTDPHLRTMVGISVALLVACTICIIILIVHKNKCKKELMELSFRKECETIRAQMRGKTDPNLDPQKLLKDFHGKGCLEGTKFQDETSKLVSGKFDAGDSSQSDVKNAIAKSIARNPEKSIYGNEKKFS